MSDTAELQPQFDALLARLEAELEILPDKPDETPRSTLLCLWALAEGRRLALSELPSYAPGALSTDQSARLETLVSQRLEGTPLAHLTGRQDFLGEVLLASPAALVPRRETEQLARTTIDRLRSIGEASPLVIDVCTGAGNIALAMAGALPEARVFGADLSEDAVDLARENARFLDRERVEFRCGDLLAPFETGEFLGRVDMITCNPPYISSGRVEQMPGEISRHEPRLAFDGGPFGVGIIRKLFSSAPALLRPGGWLVLEVGLGQGPGLARSLAGQPAWSEVLQHADKRGEIRVIEARFEPPHGGTDS
ncbi:HemK/PrmC family methyltransferase [Thioalkalivibrio sp. XN8]|uniref:N5-glutamine methyltransferase family protein n=1 Tax=Thioalkalivibrio sp. XN8 TaxID=2712863 RepID=UPI0013EB3A0C|nr:HemK/PrmC family methyltransferase [Thioalkalivibrio sp. XN8]NGP53684.1 peptide chain release factor N(5)-glutamine methyltransferase [Thioalkalivibrio sp. XN8]